MQSRELEVKLLAGSAAALEARAGRSTLAGCPLEGAGARLQEDTYLDSADFALLRSGLSLRLRAAGSRIRATLKEVPGPEGRAALRDRSEVELELASAPELPWTPAGEIGELTAPLLEGRLLAPVLSISTRRTKRRLLREGSPAAEMCLDAVEVRAPGEERVAARFFEVEVEDMGGGRELLLCAGEELQEEQGLAASTLSKLERGLDALGLLARLRSGEGP